MCLREDCDRLPVARGYCHRCYMWARTKPGWVLAEKGPAPTCSAEDCERLAKCRGLCFKHYGATYPHSLSTEPGHKMCPDCSRSSADVKFPKNKRGAHGLGTYCSACHSERGKASKRKHGDKGIQRRRTERKAMLAKLGGACVCCQERTFEFLQFDHIDSDGAAHRASKGKLSLNMREIEAELHRFQILCANCNSAKQYYGGCPHNLREWT